MYTRQLSQTRSTGVQRPKLSEDNQMRRRHLSADAIITRPLTVPVDTEMDGLTPPGGASEDENDDGI